MLPGGGDGMLRQRRLRPVEAVKSLDAFPKTAEEVKEQTSSGGSVSIFIFLVTALLVFFEFRYYISTDVNYSYTVDGDYNRKIRLNIDLTVAAKCESIGADIVDQSESSTIGSEDHVKLDPVSFKMSPSRRSHWQILSQTAEYVRKEHHALHNILWRSGFDQKRATSHLEDAIEAEDDEEQYPKDACRIHGHYTLNKIAGNLHIIAGKSMNIFPFGHAHMQMVMPIAGGGILIGGMPAAVNFSHRITHLSFGTPVRGMVHPLDGDEKITTAQTVMYQYLIKVIPTEVDTSFARRVHTFQMAVTENDRMVSHHEGSHGMPGIYIKYDFSPLAVKIEEHHKPYWQFIVRLCGIIGGVFATTGFLHFVVGFFIDAFLCRWRCVQDDKSGDVASTTNGNTVHANGVKK